MIKERRPGISPGSIHCPVRCMRHLIDVRDVRGIESMIRQLRDGWKDRSRTDRERAEFLWLGRRYQEGYEKITGSKLP